MSVDSASKFSIVRVLYLVLVGMLLLLCSNLFIYNTLLERRALFYKKLWLETDQGLQSVLEVMQKYAPQAQVEIVVHRNE